MVYCPKCKNVIVRFVELSCGGDGLYVCDVCGWVENPTKVFKPSLTRFCGNPECINYGHSWDANHHSMCPYCRPDMIFDEALKDYKNKKGRFDDER